MHLPQQGLSSDRHQKNPVRSQQGHSGSARSDGTGLCGRLRQVSVQGKHPAIRRVAVVHTSDKRLLRSVYDPRRNTVTNRGSATPLHQLRHRHQTVVEASLAQPAELRRYASGGRGSGCTCCHNASAVQCYVLLHLEYIFVVPVRVQPLCFSRVRV